MLPYIRSAVLQIIPSPLSQKIRQNATCARSEWKARSSGHSVQNRGKRLPAAEVPYFYFRKAAIAVFDASFLLFHRQSVWRTEQLCKFYNSNFRIIINLHLGKLHEHKQHNFTQLSKLFCLYLYRNRPIWMFELLRIYSNFLLLKHVLLNSFVLMLVFLAAFKFFQSRNN